jgi:SAM-dependent methyltransferase
VVIYPERYRAGLLKYTRAAFAMLPPMTAPNILDAGCGTGQPTLCLAELTDGVITGVDADPAALTILEEKIEAAGLGYRVRTHLGDIRDGDFESGVFDIIWAEGAIAGIGFTEAIATMGEFLTPGGFLAVHDDSQGFKEKLAVAENTGFLVHGYFLISKEVWWNTYYRPLEEDLLSATGVSPASIYRLDRLKKELKAFKESEQRFSSLFIMLEKQPTLSS